MRRNDFSISYDQRYEQRYEFSRAVLPAQYLLTYSHTPALLAYGPAYVHMAFKFQWACART